jgi:CBS domain-containing protein
VAQKVRDLMVDIPISIAPSATIREAAEAMRDYAIGDVLVVEGEELRGMVTDRDIVIRALAEGRDPASTSVREVWSTDLATVRPEEDSDQAVRLMRQRAVRRLPVVDDGGRAVGTVTIGDLAVAKDPNSALADISAAPPSE